jgi:hypothetical protein
MTLDERLQALAPLGFTPRQTRFLVTVALHSGYCLRRQYACFARVAYGKNVRSFLDDLVDRRLANRFSYRTNRGHLYHLHARSIYRALGHEDDRNRRHTSPAHVARKLMLLDLVLSEPGVEWFATEREKVALFTERWRVPLTDLPRSAPELDGDQVPPATTRYFGHKLPIGIAGDPPRGQFVYLATDAGALPFERFLRDHARLLRSLPAWTVIVAHGSHVAATTLWDSTFRRVVGGVDGLQTDAAQALEQYFVVRRAVERREFATLSVTDLQAFRVGQSRFIEPAIEALFKTWIAGGSDRIDPALLKSVLPDTGRLVVRTLPFTYTQFGAFAGVL